MIRRRTLQEQLDRIELILMLRDPGSSKAAEAYEGLRKSITAAVAERTSHLVQLSQIDAALQRGETTDSLALVVRDLMAQAGLERVSDPARRDCYEIDGDAGQLKVLEPAYVDVATARPVRLGRAVAQADSEPDSHATNHEESIKS